MVSNAKAKKKAILKAKHQEIQKKAQDLRGEPGTRGASGFAKGKHATPIDKQRKPKTQKTWNRRKKSGKK